MVEVLVGRLFLLLKYFTFPAEEEMKQYRLGVLELLFTPMSSQAGMLRVVCFTNVHLMPMPLQVHSYTVIFGICACVCVTGWIRFWERARFPLIRKYGTNCIQREILWKA